MDLNAKARRGGRGQRMESSVGQRLLLGREICCASEEESEKDQKTGCWSG